MRRLQLVTKDNCQKFNNPEEPEIQADGGLLLPLAIMMPFTIVAGIWLGMFVGATNVYTECFSKKHFSYSSFILTKPLEVECKAK